MITILIYTVGVILVIGLGITTIKLKLKELDLLAQNSKLQEIMQSQSITIDKFSKKIEGLNDDVDKLNKISKGNQEELKAQMVINDHLEQVLDRKQKGPQPKMDVDLIRNIVHR